MSILPQTPEAAGIAEYIVLVEAVAQIGIDPAGPEDPHIPIASATDALPASVATRVPQLLRRCPQPVLTLLVHRFGGEWGFQYVPRRIAVHLLGRRFQIQQLRLEVLPT